MDVKKLELYLREVYNAPMQRFKRFISTIFWGLLSVMLTLVIVLGVVYTYLELQLPDVEVLKDVHLQVPLRIYSSDGKLIAQYGTKRRIPVTMDQVPKQLIQAVLATEDARYYSHPGVDFVSLVRAAKAVISSGRKVQGASTITMQVARNFFLTSKKTYGRKIKEILLALKIDKELSKDKVLELYLNKIYFGNRAYGVAAAAQVYYGKTLDQLTLPEMAMLAGLPQSPSAKNPLRNPAAAIDRRNHVLQRMYEVGFITKEEYLKAIKAPNTAKYHGQSVQLRAHYIAEMVRQLMLQEYGERAYDIGLEVYTTIDSRLQIDAVQSLQDGLIAYSQRHGFNPTGVNLGMPDPTNFESWQQTLKKVPFMERMQPAVVITVNQDSVDALLANGSEVTIPWSGLSWAKPSLPDGYVGKAPQKASDIVTEGDFIWVMQDNKNEWQLTQIPKVQGAIVSMDPQNGAILALSGGFDYNQSSFNRAVMAKRQVGSNFKPFIWSAALDKGFTLASTINDAPIVTRGYGEDTMWRPTNDTLKFYGPTRLRVGLTESRNIVAIRLLQAIGVKYAINYLTRFGFNANELPHSLTLALGSGSESPAKVAAAYSVFANGGFQVKPFFIQKILDQRNNVIYQNEPAVACEACITDPNAPKPKNMAPEVLSPQTAYLITQALRGVIQNGTGKAAKVLNRPDLAGKTGTTNDQVDTWFSGFNSHLVTTVWVGYDNSEPLHEYAWVAALPIWIEYMGAALKDTPEATMPQPADIVIARIDPTTGLLASPDQGNAIFEYFNQQKMPKHYAGNSASAPSSSEDTGSPAAPAAAAPATNSEPLF